MIINKRLLGISWIAFLVISITVYFFAIKFTHIPRATLSNIYFYSLCAGIVLLLCISRDVDNRLKVFFDITAIYYAYLLIMYILKDIANINLMPIYGVTGGFIICYIYLLARHNRTLSI